MRFLRELKKLRVVLPFAVAVLIGARPLRADVTGSILGYVRDSSGAVFSNATLTITQASTGYIRVATADGSGQYSILALPPGTYRLTASDAGFENGVIENINLNVNDALKFDFVLKVGNVSQIVSVDASSVQVDTATTSLGTTITSSQILAMPLNGRSYLDLLALQPGIAPANTNSSYNDRSPASGLYGSSGNVSTDGQPEGTNAFLVNGAEVNETKNMGAGMIPDADSVAEFRLITNSFSAEYGKFTGSVINTVTKSGTNSFHGALFEFYRNQKMDAINYFDTNKAELKRHQFGGVVGGPIWKDRLFAFTDYQQTRQHAGASTGLVQVLSIDERDGIFSDAMLNTPVQGDAWAATLESRGGGNDRGSVGGLPGSRLTNISLDYPTQVGPLQKLNPRSVSHNYFNPSAFANGLSCGYEVCGVTGSAKLFLFQGPGSINTDLGVEKDTKITERTAFNLRLEMFNVFNHANFLSNSVVGNANSGQFGQATNTAPARVGQVSGKFIF